VSWAASVLNEGDHDLHDPGELWFPRSMKEIEFGGDASGIYHSSVRFSHGITPISHLCTTHSYFVREDHFEGAA
jgi:hypothetical protein